MALSLNSSNELGDFSHNGCGFCDYYENITNTDIDIIRPHRCTTYIDAAYCYRRSSVVCLSVLGMHGIKK